MFIEMRTYTLLPGRLARFWEIQTERGFDVVQPIMERLVCYFGIAGQQSDRVVHLWRYDSYEDWKARLHGLYGKPELDAYFPKVRELMTQQDNTVLGPAPIAALTPVLGNGNDWLPTSGPRFSRNSAFEMEVVDFLPGTLPAFWARLREDGGGASADPDLLGVFSTEIGRQHRVVALRANSQSTPEWEHALDALSATVIARTRHDLLIPPIAAMAPIVRSL